MNLGLAIIAALCFHLVVYLPVIAAQWVTLNLKNALIINVTLAVFNLFPYHHLMGGVLRWVCSQMFSPIRLPGLSLMGWRF